MSNGYKKGPYNELCHHLWDSLAPSVHKFLCNPVGPGQFSALPSERLALWQHKQLNVSVCHASVVNMLGAQVTTCQHVLPLLKATPPYRPVCMVLHILHTISSAGSGLSLVQHTSHTKHTSYLKSALVLADHPSLIRHAYGIYMCQLHA